MPGVQRGAAKRDMHSEMIRLVSINVGRPRRVHWNGETVSTSIFKSPVNGPVALRKHQLEGDQQGDPSLHGGPTKAVYAYPAHHYDYWRSELGIDSLPWGSFGENFTVDGLDEESARIGDAFSVGTARVRVTEPRTPCFKLGIRFNRPDMVKRFLRSGRTGFYLGVVEEGDVKAGDRLERLVAGPGALRVADVIRLYTTEKRNAALLQKAVAVKALPEAWRTHFAQQLAKLQG